MKMQEVSKRYAKGLFEAALQVNKAALALEQIKIVNMALSSDSEIPHFFNNPINGVENKLKVLLSLNDKVKPMDEVAQFLKILVQNGRLQHLAEIIIAYQSLLDDSQGVTRGVVVSAQSLNEEAKKSLSETISKVVQKKVILDYEINPAVVGGIVADVHGLTFDDSLQRHLTRMNEELNRRRE